MVLASPARAPIYLNWSPDDRFLAVLSSTQESSLALDVIDVSRPGGARLERTTLSLGLPFYWVWSATGRSLRVHRDVMRRAAVVGLSPITEFEVRHALVGGLCGAALGTASGDWSFSHTLSEESL